MHTKLNNSKITELTIEEQRSIDGGIVCGGLCIAAVVTLGLAAGAGFGMGFVNRNREMQK